MLKKEQNDLVTQTGPGTSMGNLFRRYWMPALLSQQLPTPDCDPVRLELFSEKMVAFRDTQGRLGLIDEFCAHRGVSLWFGRNEENGLRCPYHGWKFDIHGQCIEVPSEPTFKPCFLFAQWQLEHRSFVQGRQGQSIQLERFESCL